jgi:hypothetical protein
LSKEQSSLQRSPSLVALRLISSSPSPPLSSAQLFHRSWEKYQSSESQSSILISLTHLMISVPEKNKKVVAKDQSIMQGSLSFGRWRFASHYPYPCPCPHMHPIDMAITLAISILAFSHVPSPLLLSMTLNISLSETYPREVIYKPTLLLDKVEEHSIHGVRFELGSSLHR